MRKYLCFILLVFISFTINAQKNDHSLPFIENFDDAASLQNWTIIDVNDDGTWTHYDWIDGPDGEAGALQITRPGGPSGPGVADDYLIIGNPIIFPTAGWYHLSFYVNPFTNNESLKVLYGSTQNHAEMELLSDYPNINGDGWNQIVSNFEITTPGNYYFAFHYYSNYNNGGWFMDFDKVEIAEGIFGGVPDIEFVLGIGLVSGCYLSSESLIGVEVRNIGTGTISVFTLTYQIGNEAPVSQIFNETIAVQQYLTVYFDQTADLSALGSYHIKFTATTPDEENSDNNETEITVKHFAPITELPFESNFDDEDDINDWFPETEYGWIALSTGCYRAEKTDVPLISRCIELEPGVYRFIYNFLAGHLRTFVIYYDDFYVTFGKSGTDASTWVPVNEHYDCFTYEEIVEDEFIVNIVEAGEYQFAFYPVQLNAFSDKLSVFSTFVEKMIEYDFRILNVAPPISFPRIIPKQHIENEHKFKVTIENRGLSASANGTAEIFLNDNLLVSNEFSFTELNEVINIDLHPTFEQLSTGEYNLLFKVQLEDDIIKEIEKIKIVSDSTFAWDRLDDGIFLDRGIGAEEPVRIGLIYELQKADILTSITVRLMEYEKRNSGDMGLAVYEVDDNLEVDENLEVGEMLFYVEHNRTNGNNMEGITFEVPETELVPGKYFFEIRQLDDENISVSYDLDPEGYFYVHNSTGNLDIIERFGYIHLRPNFGKSCSSIPKNIVSNILLFPNPTTDNIYITSDFGLSNIKIYDVSGRMIKEYKKIDKNEYKIDLSRLNSGLYFVNIDGTTVKVVKK